MYINKKILWVCMGCVLLFTIYTYFFLVEPDYGLRPKDFKLRDITQIEVTKLPKDTTFIITDSVLVEKVIKAILNSNEISIQNPPSRKTKFELKIKYLNNEYKYLELNQSPEGYWFSLIHSKYHGNKLFQVLNEMN